MGVNNRQRRAAKAKRRTREQQRRAATPGPGRPPPERIDPVDCVRQLLREAVRAVSAGDRAAFEDGLVQLDPELVDAVAEAQLVRSLDLMWRNGWQPAEVVRQARRVDARAGRLVAAGVVADHVDRPSSTLHPRWATQVEALDTPPIRSRTGWLQAFADHELVHRAVLIATVVVATRTLTDVGAVRELLPPPGEGAGRAAAHLEVDVDEGMLAKVRALLSQAESTTYEAEAEAFTAKAEELMARHAIDAAVVWSTATRRDQPTATRVAIDDPYADLKSLLLQIVAEHTRCRTVWDGRYGWSTLVGFATDVAATELLFTSLLVQAAAALQAEAAKAGPGGLTRSRSFRSSFLFGFANRIGQRLETIRVAAEDAADDGSSSLLPVLAARSDAVDEEVDAMFGALLTSTVRGARDATGWARGKLAADLARLDAGELRAAGRAVGGSSS